MRQAATVAGALVLLLVLCACVLPATDRAQDDQKDRCAAEGGCMTITKAALSKVIEVAYTEGARKGAELGFDRGSLACMRPA
jgi:hypothetical protein